MNGSRSHWAACRSPKQITAVELILGKKDRQSEKDVAFDQQGGD
jgi:hypothetical protein